MKSRDEAINTWFWWKCLGPQRHTSFTHITNGICVSPQKVIDTSGKECAEEKQEFPFYPIQEKKYVTRQGKGETPLQRFDSYKQKDPHFPP
jgi:hypothetical protein